MEDILGYLESRFSKVKRASATEANVPCPFCGEDETKRGRLYVNIDENSDPPGLFHCKLCDTRGAINKLKKHFGDPIVKDQDDKDSYNPKIYQILNAAAEYYFLNLAEKDEALDYLRYERGLTFETIENHKLGWADGKLRQHLESKGFSFVDMVSSGMVTERGNDFLRNQITIPYHVSNNVVSIRGKEINGKYMTPRGHKARLYNSDVTWENPDKIIITEGEFDALVLEQLGYAVVGAPGAGTWQDSWSSYLSEVKRVYICFDPDEAGKTGSEKLSTKLGAKSKIINLPEDSPGNDISDWIIGRGHTKEEFDMLMIRSKGGILISVNEAYDKWLEIEGNPELVGLKIGYPLLDRAIFPGLLPSQVMITLAKTGVGKTISLLNIFHNLSKEQPDKNILFVSLEQTRNEWFERARRIHRFNDLDASNEDTIDYWRHRFMMVDKNRITEDELVSCIEQYEYDIGYKPDLIAVDYLGYWAKSYKGESYERTSQAIMSMKAIAKEYEVPFLAPHQVSRLAEVGEEPSLNSARDSGVVEETADFIFALWAPDQRQGTVAEERTNEVFMKILKSRHGGVSTKMTLQFAPLSLAMVAKGDPLYEQAINETALANKGDSFEQAIYRHKTGFKGIIEDEHNWGKSD